MASVSGSYEGCELSRRTLIMSRLALPHTIPVWDLPVRLFHWSLVATVATAAATGFLFPANWLNIHIWAGGAVGALILARLVWGVTGSTYARFGNFDLAPSSVFAHLREIRDGQSHRTGGHNPLGSWMVLVLLLTLSGIVLTGLAVLGGMFKQGPGKAAFTYAFGRLAREPHELLAWALLLLVAAHVAGVVFETLRSKENLARAMVTGRKEVGFVPARKAYVAHKGLALSVIAAGGFALVLAGLQFNALPPRGVAAVAADPLWQAQCSDCHAPFHPTLLPAESWRKMMADLSDHFGEDASLPADAVQAITAYLVAHSAETSDSFAANAFRRVDPAKPLEITSAPFWVWRHHSIPAAVFAAPKIKAKQNCAACHGDAASGTFAPQSISIPQETTQ